MINQLIEKYTRRIEFLTRRMEFFKEYIFDIAEEYNMDTINLDTWEDKTVESLVNDIKRSKDIKEFYKIQVLEAYTTYVKAKSLKKNYTEVVNDLLNM